jgi:hypothetical protein
MRAATYVVLDYCMYVSYTTCVRLLVSVIISTMRIAYYADGAE